MFASALPFMPKQILKDGKFVTDYEVTNAAYDETNNYSSNFHTPSDANFYDGNGLKVSHAVFPLASNLDYSEITTDSYTIEGNGATTSFNTTLAYHFWRRIKPSK